MTNWNDGTEEYNLQAKIKKLEARVVELEADLASSARALQISRTQTLDAFERVALTHNECVALKNKLAKLESDTELLDIFAPRLGDVK